MSSDLTSRSRRASRRWRWRQPSDTSSSTSGVRSGRRAQPWNESSGRRPSTRSIARSMHRWGPRPQKPRTKAQKAPNGTEEVSHGVHRQDQRRPHGGDAREGSAYAGRPADGEGRADEPRDRARPRARSRRIAAGDLVPDQAAPRLDRAVREGRTRRTRPQGGRGDRRPRKVPPSAHGSGGDGGGRGCRHPGYGRRESEGHGQSDESGHGNPRGCARGRQGAQRARPPQAGRRVNRQTFVEGVPSNKVKGTHTASHPSSPWLLPQGRSLLSVRAFHFRPSRCPLRPAPDGPEVAELTGRDQHGDAKNAGTHGEETWRPRGGPAGAGPPGMT